MGASKDTQIDQVNRQIKLSFFFFCKISRVAFLALFSILDYNNTVCVNHKLAIEAIFFVEHFLF